MRKTLAPLSVVALIAACNLRTYDPADFPCGPHGLQCRSGGCCPERHDCGGDVPNCPPEMCCYSGDDSLQANTKSPKRKSR